MSKPLEALLWAWTNATGRLPDRNTMSEAEIQQYWQDYSAVLSAAIVELTGKEPDAYLRGERITPLSQADRGGAE